jgi:ankyrin repeat protein
MGIVAVTSRVENIAYCLLGIFDVTMSMIYGEESRAFLRLQQEIMKNTGDTSILAWGFGDTADEESSRETTRPVNSQRMLSAGALASSPSDFANSGHITVQNRGTFLSSQFDLSDGRLLGVQAWTVEEESGLRYGLLNCGPSDDDRVVAIPIHATSPPNNYLRPRGHHSTLMRLSSVSTPQRIYIQTNSQDSTDPALRRVLWLHINGLQKSNTKLEEYHPQLERLRNRVMVAELGDGGKSTSRHQHAMRFRSRRHESSDVVVILEFEIEGSTTTVACHVMALSRKTPLETLLDSFGLLRPQALGHQEFVNDEIGFAVAIKEEQVAQDRVVTMNLSRMRPSPSLISIDADRELKLVARKLNFVMILKMERRLCSRLEDMSPLLKEQIGRLQKVEGELERAEAKLKEMIAQRDALAARVSEETKEVEALRSETKSVLDEKLKQHHMRDQIARQIQGFEDESRLGNAGGGPLARLFAQELVLTSRLTNGSASSTHDDDGLGANGASSATERSGLETSTSSDSTNIATDRDESQASTDLTESSTLDASRGSESHEHLLNSAMGHKNQDQMQQLSSLGVAAESKGITELMMDPNAFNALIVRFLIDAVANVDIRTVEKMTSLHLASIVGHESVVRLLIDAGVNINAQTVEKMTALHLASVVGHEHIARLLLDATANYDVQCDEKITALHLACGFGHESVARLLLDAGANVDAQADEQATPLHLASCFGRKAIVKLLISAGADINARDENGKTPIMHAATDGHKGIVSLLLESGADVEAEDKDGQTAKLMASSGETKELLIGGGSAGFQHAVEPATVDAG